MEDEPLVTAEHSDDRGVGDNKNEKDKGEVGIMAGMFRRLGLGT